VTFKDLEQESQRRVRETDELQKRLSQAAKVTGWKLEFAYGFLPKPINVDMKCQPASVSWLN
jgi:hypothetical protein